MKKNKKINSETMSFFLLRSTYFNSKNGSRIPAEYFYITIPTEAVEKVDQQQFEEFMTAVYDNNFDNPNSIEKMKNDYERYFRTLDKSFNQ